MCTAITYTTNNHYFGRNLDLYYRYNENVVITPRNYSFRFRNAMDIKRHYAVIGMAMVVDNYPLYYDATNEKGLSMAALNFPKNAKYNPIKKDVDNIASFEFIPWILGRCSNISEVKVLLSNINITDVNFSNKYPNSPLHWLIADKDNSITVESVEGSLNVYDNPIGVLTNNPPFDMQIFNLNNYINITAKEPVNRFSDKINLETYSLGMGGVGLPGDFSSSSRFVRATFVKFNSVICQNETESISQFFHILDAVSQKRGCVSVGNDKYEYTIYSSCCNVDKCIYYYVSYYNRQISGVELFKEDIESDTLIVYPLQEKQNINIIN